MPTKKDKKRVLITGNLGYIGSEILEEVKKRRGDYLAIDADPQSGPREFCFSLSDFEKTSKAVADFKPDVVIHCGSHSALAYRDNFFDTCMEDFRGLTNIVRSLSALPRTRLIYFSSSYVYSGLPVTDAVTEDIALKPAHNFGVGKSFFEQFILRNHGNSVIFRLSSVFGPGNARHPNTILGFARECLEKNAVHIWGRGERKLQYIFMRDVVDSVLASVAIAPGVYNLAGDEYVSVAEAAQAIAEFFGAKAVFMKDKPEGETLPFLANEKIKKVLGKNPFTPFPAALAEYLATLKRHEQQKRKKTK